jgi:hypothetical protein
LQHGGDRAHGGAADSDEMDGFEGGGGGVCHESKGGAIWP